MKTFLLEIGTEELPADFARLVLPQLEELVCRDFKQKRLGHGTIHCTSTPRRIGLVVESLDSVTKVLEEDRKGPPASQAYKNGKPTQAAFGFAKRLGLPVEALVVRDTEKGPFVFAKLVEKGMPASQCLCDLIPQWICNLQGRRFMRWGDGNLRFSRPIRWLVALLGDEVIPVCLEGTTPRICAGSVSRGHRLYQKNVLIPSAGSYVKSLEHEGVMVERDQRSKLISDVVTTAASSLDARPDLPEDLLEELTDLVESPLLIEGNIPDSFLSLPAEVLSTVMRVHQRYVPLYKIDNQKDPLNLEARNTLLPRFLCISNGLLKAQVNIQKGNERVLKARLADAQFFIEVDRGITSKARRNELGKVTFAKGLGSLLDRVKRMEWLTDIVLNQLCFDETKADHIRRAAYLCKHDLVSQMVGEFPELQGVIGGKYLLAEKEPREVALAVLEHYQPRGAGDEMPGSDEGATLALVERIELLLSIYAKGERPSGSSDPYALRRAGNGLLQIIWFKKWRLDLNELLHRATVFWKELLPDLKINSDELKIELSDFVRQRMISLLEESGVDIDLVQAVAGETVSISRLLIDPLDLYERVNLLVKMRKSGELQFVQAVVTRAARLADKGDLPTDILDPSEVVDSDLFEKKSESDIFDLLKSLEPIVKGDSSNRYEHLAKKLIDGSKALEAFFDGDQSVLVMSENPAIRVNRLNLLGILRNQASIFADFSRIT